MAKKDTVKEAEDQDAQAQVVLEDPEINTPPDALNVTEETEEQLPVDVDPEEGITGQAPVLTPGVNAPISSQALPNAQRDATAMAADNGVLATAEPVAPEPLVEGGDAYALAKLLERRPHWINNLDQLDELMKAEGLEPIAWAKNPVDLLEDAKRYNFYFVGNNGNFLPGDRGPVAR